MTAYTKPTVSHYKGRYFRTVGKGLDAGGVLKPKRFLLGTDAKAAALAARLLEDLWRAVVAEHEESVRWNAHFGGRLGDTDAVTGEWDPTRLRDLTVGPIWRAESLAVAEAIRRGEREVAVHPWRNRPASSYVEQVAQLKRLYPVIAFVPSCAELFAQGRSQLAGNVVELKREATEVAALAEMKADESGPTLHEALDAYARYAQARTTKESGIREAETAARLKRSHPDTLLSEFSTSQMEKMAAYWRGRPKAIKTGRPIALSTVTNHLKTAKRFVRWLDRSSDFAWNKPAGAETALRADVERLRTDDEIAALAGGVPVWPVGELAVLYAYANEMERLLILLGLNCGFCHAEACTLRLDEVHRVDGVATIKRVRRKNRVYGEFALWPETLEAIDRFVGKGRSGRRQPSREYVLETSAGQVFTRQRIANTWNRLHDRIATGGGECRRLSFKYLRKTAGQLVRDRSNGEITAVFHCRDKAVARDDYADAYTNRPFKQLATVLQEVRVDLGPMFSAS